jgi:hypothetical protein
MAKQLSGAITVELGHDQPDEIAFATQNRNLVNCEAPNGRKMKVRVLRGVAYKKKEYMKILYSLEIKQGVKSTPIYKTRPNDRGRIRL